jgi:serine phosphatase RsbU (regulator of sigma subunit)
MDLRGVAASYQPSLLSVPPGIALAAVLVVLTYAAVVRGSAELRGWFLLHTAPLLPYLLTMVLAPSIDDAELVTIWFRVSAAMVPLSAAAGVAFRLALIRRQVRPLPGGSPGSQVLRAVRPSRARLLGGATLAAAAALAVPVIATPWVVAGARPGVLGILFGTPGPLAPVWLAVTLMMPLAGLRPFLEALRDAGNGPRGRQLTRMWIATAIVMAALVDVAIGYGAPLPPIGWLLVSAGSVLALRALVVEDLLRVRAIDTRAPQLMTHLAGGVLLGWAVLQLLHRRLPWWGEAIALIGAFGSVRVGVAIVTLIVRGARLFQKPLERLLVQLTTQLRTAESEQALEEALASAVEIAAEAPASILVPSGSDYGWSRGNGERIDDATAPDPRLIGWLTDQPALFFDDLEEVPPELRRSLGGLFEAHDARMIVPLCSHGELLGLLVVGGEQPMRGAALRFVTRAAERLAEALSHVRIVRQVRERAAIARQVELAAQLQASYLPTEAHRDLSRVRVAGIWRPATQCGGDFWAVYEVGPGRALVVVGDVTGHGVSAAMVTAAVRGACDVSVRHAGEGLQLPTLLATLDAVVSRVGAERLHMSCLVAIVDATAGEVRFLSAGHATPYLVRAAPGCPASKSGECELEALVARGHALGSGHPPPSRVVKKPIRPGDLILWYTDGITEAANRGREAFGDRRLQRLLRGLPPDSAPDAVVHLLLDAVSLHRGEPTFDDDVTLVVARVREPDALLAVAGET